MSQQQHYPSPLEAPPLQQSFAPRPQKEPGFLDIGFTQFLSLRLISIWWVLSLVLIGVSATAGVSYGLYYRMSLPWLPAWYGGAIILGSVVGAVLAVVLVRLFLEGIAVLFRIADNTSRIADKV
jgi:hypothetical protein